MDEKSINLEAVNKKLRDTQQNMERSRNTHNT